MTQEAYFVLAHVVLVGAEPAGPPSSIDSDASRRLSLIVTPVLKQPMLALTPVCRACSLTDFIA
jgi:hypothetical protein